ncbi:MAG: hypothetical protein WAO20_10835, partial [Acidobacteriota bacterium]
EMAGITSPFVDRLRTEIEQAAEAESRKKLDQMKSTYDSEIEQVRREADRQMAEQLRERLLSLAGFGSGGPHTGD